MITQAQLDRAAEACVSLLEITARLGRRRRGRPKNFAALAATLMFSKARGSATAVIRLVGQGFVPEAMIVARSLAGLCIDIAFIAEDPKRSAERALDWQAVGRLARRSLARKAGVTAPDEARIDWTDAEERRRRWSSGGLPNRAREGGTDLLYGWAYRYGSTFAHSDAWSMMTLERRRGDRHVRNVIAHLALLSTAYSLVAVSYAWADLSDLDIAKSKPEIEKVFRNGFSVEQRPSTKRR